LCSFTRPQVRHDQLHSRFVALINGRAAKAADVSQFVAAFIESHKPTIAALANVRNEWKGNIGCGTDFCMSEPNLKLDGLSLWVRGRAIPDASDCWDGNWLTVRATMHAGQSSVTTEGTIHMTTDFERFRSELAQMYETLTGEASLASYEPNLKVTLRASGLGQIAGKVEITPDHMSEFHSFEVGFDQTYLPPLITDCEGILERFPVIGEPDS
jgi:hypothetical protein